MPSASETRVKPQVCSSHNPSVLSRIGVEPEHCVGFEDAVLGMAAIRAAGFLHAIDVTALPDYPVIVD